MTVRRLVARLPDILAARDLRGAVERIAGALRRGRPVVLGMGAHPIKVGLGPVIVDLIERRRLAAVAMNGACLVHDFELAWNGRTSEDVGPGLERGTFGDRKSTRLNSSHLVISYAVFCLKKKKKRQTTFIKSQSTP